MVEVRLRVQLGRFGKRGLQGFPLLNLNMNYLKTIIFFITIKFNHGLQSNFEPHYNDCWNKSFGQCFDRLQLPKIK